MDSIAQFNYYYLPALRMHLSHLLPVIGLHFNFLFAKYLKKE